MAEYEVILTREVTQEGCILVEADSADEAKKKVEQIEADEVSWETVELGRHWSVSADKMGIAETCEDDLRAIQAKLEALDGSDTRLLDDLRAEGCSIVSEDAEIKGAVRGLLDFIAEKYGDVEKVEDFTCSHHRKLAGLVGWVRRTEG